MIHVIAHRGWWNLASEQNTLTAFARAFDVGIGVELDVRDVWDEDGGVGDLFVSHDPVMTSEIAARCLRFSRVLALLGDRPNMLAVNVKSCGLAPYFAKLTPPQNWFFFDMADNDVGEYAHHDLPYQASFVISGDLFPSLAASQVLKQWGSLRQSSVDQYLITDKPAEAMEFFK